MSDDWGSYRSDQGDDEKDDLDTGRDDPGGWSEDDPGVHKTHWEDDAPEANRESESGWPTSGSTWQRPESADTSSGWERSDYGDYDRYGYLRKDDLFDDVEEPEPHPSRHSRDPLAHLFPGLPRGVRVTLDWILTIAGAILIVLALKQWVVNPYRIPSSSMEPTLNCAKGPLNPGCLGDSSDRVLACRICLDFGHNPSRGDIVVFNTPSSAALKCGEGGTFVKRLIGLPGETVTERTGKVFIDGKPLKESYIKFPDSQSGTWHVPKGQYFFMGDNRAQSCDSRQWGSVPRGNLIGTVFFVYWPPNRIGFR